MKAYLLKLLTALEKHIQAEGKFYQSPDMAAEFFYLRGENNDRSG